MSATNHTTNYELPIFVGSDKPAWLVDWNGAMTAIDTAIHTAEGKADQAGTDIGGIESSISTINSTLTSINNAVSQLRLDTNANTGSIHTIQELIGNGTPTTTDKTIIGAINELNTKAEHGVIELWKNANIHDAFAPSTIQLTDFDDDRFDAIIIVSESVPDEVYGPLWYEFDKDVLSITSYTGSQSQVTLTSAGQLRQFSRNISFIYDAQTNVLSVVFAEGKSVEITAIGSPAQVTTMNDRMIPIRILGIIHNS